MGYYNNKERGKEGETTNQFIILNGNLITYCILLFDLTFIELFALSLTVDITTPGEERTVLRSGSIYNSQPPENLSKFQTGWLANSDTKASSLSAIK